jgi:hypothetical protein
MRKYKHETNSTFNGIEWRKPFCKNVKSCYFIYKNTEKWTLEKIKHVNRCPLTGSSRTPYISTVLNPRGK